MVEYLCQRKVYGIGYYEVPGDKSTFVPGGGYTNLAMRHEGYWVAEWLNERGIAACILVYRMPRGTHHQAPIIDVQNAFRYCRHHAPEWGVRQIGVMGFSAGGHLAACASTLYVDEVTRPDFSILVYPVITFDETVKKKGTLEQMTEVTTIPARGLDLSGDRFALEQVTPNTRVTTLDDIDINFDFELCAATGSRASCTSSPTAATAGAGKPLTRAASPIPCTTASGKSSSTAWTTSWTGWPKNNDL